MTLQHLISDCHYGWIQMLVICLFAKLNYLLPFLVNGCYDDLPRPGKVPQIVAERFKVIILGS